MYKRLWTSIKPIVKGEYDYTRVSFRVYERYGHKRSSSFYVVR